MDNSLHQKSKIGLAVLSFATCFFVFMTINWLFWDFFSNRWFLFPALSASFASAAVTYWMN